MSLVVEGVLSTGRVEQPPISRLDSKEKVTGRAIYSLDMKLPGMLYGRIKRSPYPRARILHIDARDAEEIAGVRSIITGKDFPIVTTNVTPALARGEVLYTNQAVVAVAADTPEIAERASEHIYIEYQELTPVFDSELTALPESLSRIVHGVADMDSRDSRHVKLVKGDLAAAFRRAHFVVENSFSTSMESHLQLEPLSYLARTEPGGAVTVWGVASGAQKLRLQLAAYLGIDPYLIRTIVPSLGGYFGPKEEAHVAAICAMLAIKTGRPVKLWLSREENMTATGARHPSVIHVKDAVTKSGLIIGREIKAVFNGGAYGSISIENARLAASSVYDIPNMKLDAYRVHTNLVPATYKRAPVGTEVTWAIESQMDYIAAKLNIDPLEIRLRNLLRNGSINPLGEVMESISHDEALLRVAEAIGWREKPSDDSLWRRGKGIAIGAKWSRGGPYEAMVKFRETGKLEVLADIVENGQGIYTGIAQLAAAEFNIPIEDVVIVPMIYGSDSVSSGLSAGFEGSRQLVNLGNAVLTACRDAKKKIAAIASRRFGCAETAIEIKDGFVIPKTSPEKAIRIASMFSKTTLTSDATGSIFSDEALSLTGYGSAYTKTGTLDESTGRVITGRVSLYYVTVAQAADLSVNTETGQIRVHRIAAAMDVGKAINPELVKGQILGSVMMALSAALGEEAVLSKGRIVNANLADYKIVCSTEAPDIIPLILETPYSGGPFNAKSAGEPSMLPTAAAIRNAVHNAAGIWIDSLPITPEKVLETLGDKMLT